ncbi:MAG: DUF2334 domain-containing protein [Clostridiales Family XIII bacterium]|jgi:predicted deacetylase|nr:DUF2334 domain-containing protein [Clostridiales Family XIII bacterium]
MTKIIVRLDDACPVMNHDIWGKIEEILDKNGVKPVVGIIPENRDTLFTWAEDPAFWRVTAKRWASKGWCIAQHGCYHLYQADADKLDPLELTEFKGFPKDTQRELIETGYRIMSAHGINPEGFFAPNHSFDDNTVDALRESGHFKFLSDGMSFGLFRYRGMVFIPYIPASRKFPVKPNIMTQVLHPNIMDENAVASFAHWLSDNKQDVTEAPALFSGQDDIRDKKHLSAFSRVYPKALNLVIALYNRFRK